VTVARAIVRGRFHFEVPMIRSAIALIAALMFAWTAPLGASLRAQEETPTVSKQELARSKFKDLTERMAKLMVALQPTEPDTSGLLGAGLQYVKEVKIPEEMERIRTLLDRENWDDALGSIAEVRKKLQKLYELLQNRNTDLRKLMEEIARLQAFKDRVEQLSKEQADEKEASARAERLQQHLKDLEAQKAKAEALLAEQKQVKEQTNQLGVQAVAEAAKPLEQKEGQLKEEADKLAKDLEAIEKKAEELRAEAKAAEAKAGEPKAGEPKAGEPKAGEPKPSEAKPGEGKCSGSAGKAAQAMSQAQQQLGQKKPESALKDQQHAIEQLQQTVQELQKMTEEAQRELLKLPFEQQAKKQEDTQHATDTLAKAMEKSEQQQNESGEPKATPGKKRVQQAVPKQKAAVGQLKEYKPAKQKQQDAKDDLEAAKKELEDALAQLRQQLSDEVLKALEERFTAMLAKQRELSLQTKTLDKTRQNLLTSAGQLPAALVEKIQGVASGEGDLEVDAADALKLLEEDGTTAVFVEMTGELKTVLQGVAKRCRANETAKPVQEGQAEVEDLLTLLINSLRREIERRDGAGQCNCNGQPPLVPISAELKMLRYLQERVNKSTKEFDAKAAEVKGNDDGRAQSDVLASKQGRVQELMRKLAAKLDRDADSGEGR
jgi:myosin heavy subunit